MHINRVLNHQYFYELYKQNYLSAHKARLAVQKDLNDAIKAQSSSTPFYESLGYEDAFSYLEAQSNLNRQSIYDFNTGLSNFQRSLIELSDSLISAQEAVYSYQRARSEESEESEKTILIGEQEVKLILAEESEDGTKIYSTDPDSLEIATYLIENMSFETFYDNTGNINISSSADLIINDSIYELSLSENDSGNYIFRLVNNSLEISNSNYFLENVYLSENGLEFDIDIETYSRTRTIESNDQAILDTLKLLETRYGAFESGFAETLEEDAKEKQTSILEEFIFKASELEQFSLLQELLKVRINAIYEDDQKTNNSSLILYSLIK